MIYRLWLKEMCVESRKATQKGKSVLKIGIIQGQITPLKMSLRWFYLVSFTFTFQISIFYRSYLAISQKKEP